MWSEKDLINFKINAFKLCQEFLAGQWKEITLNDFGFSKVCGGLSNKLYLCSLPSNLELEDKNTPRNALLRIYGLTKEKHSEKYIESLIQDAVVYTLLAERRLGPKLYGVFNDGRLEEYIPSKILSSDDMRKMYVLVAKEVAKVHALHVPIRKTPDTFFQLGEGWLKCFENNVGDHEEELNSRTKIVVTKEMLRAEYEWVSDLVHNLGSPIVFCHNDLQGGNILQRCDENEEKDENKLILIDFEVAFYNYRGFDITNHFCEWCFDYNTETEPHFESDLNKFPTIEEQETFIEVYLDELEKDEDSYLRSRSKKEEKSKILREVEVFKMFVNLYWSIWGFRTFVIARDEFKFGLVEFAEARLRLYQMCKKEFQENIHIKKHE